MYTVKYEKYYNDYRKSQEVKTFRSLEEVADWLFGMVRGEYSKSVLFFVDLDNTWSRIERLDPSCIQSGDGEWMYSVEQIEKDGVIIYSCGTFTNGIRHCNEEVKQWLKECRKRKEHPQFNFG